MGMVRKLCGDPARDALRAIGRTVLGTRPPVPADFTPEERFRMFRAVLHEQVYPMRHFGPPDRRATRSVSYSPDAWLLFGRRRFVREVRAAAAAELRQADYAVYDLGPVRTLVGNDGRLFCRRLSALDAAEMEVRMRGMEADLDVLTRKLAGGRMPSGADGAFRYRIALYECVFEVTIRKGIGEWIRSLVS